MYSKFCNVVQLHSKQTNVFHDCITANIKLQIVNRKDITETSQIPLGEGILLRNVTKELFKYCSSLLFLSLFFTLFTKQKSQEASTLVAVAERVSATLIFHSCIYLFQQAY